jgi:DNA-dependent protein kinase catalytic subunit
MSLTMINIDYSKLNLLYSDMYIRDTEDLYLLYATRVLLNNTKKTYDFNQPIFERPLPNARFDADYQKINTSWHSTSSMMPLFSTSQGKSVSIVP